MIAQWFRTHSEKRINLNGAELFRLNLGFSPNVVVSRKHISHLFVIERNESEWFGFKQN